MKQIKPESSEPPVRTSVPGSDTSGSELNCFHIEVLSSQKDMVNRDSIETFGPQSVSPSFAMVTDSFVDLSS